MRYFDRFTLCVATFVFTLYSCDTNRRTDHVPSIDPEQVKEPLMDANKIRVHNETNRIENYIQRQKWEMNATGSGLRYMFLIRGAGDSVKTAMVAHISYKVRLLDGSLCYSSETDGEKVFEIGKGEVEIGLEEAILLMQSGDSARFILPSHIAYGLAGDGNKIPIHAVLVYEVNLLSVGD